MSETYEINEFGEVVPYRSGRRVNDTAAWREATELELSQRDEIKELQQEIEKLERQRDIAREELGKYIELYHVSEKRLELALHGPETDLPKVTQQSPDQ